MADATPYELGLAMGCQYAQAAFEEDEDAFEDDPDGTAQEAWEYDNPHSSREWYEYGFDEYGAYEWEEFDDGFEKGVNAYLNGAECP